jgi:hypothetical protein
MDTNSALQWVLQRKELKLTCLYMALLNWRAGIIWINSISVTRLSSSSGETCKSKQSASTYPAMVQAKADYVKFHNSSVCAMWMDWTFTSIQCCTGVGKLSKCTPLEVLFKQHTQRLTKWRLWKEHQQSPDKHGSVKCILIKSFDSIIISIVNLLLLFLVHSPHHNKSLEFHNKTIHAKEKLVFPIKLIKCYSPLPTLGLAV